MLEPRTFWMHTGRFAAKMRATDALRSPVSCRSGSAPHCVFAPPAAVMPAVKRCADAITVHTSFVTERRATVKAGRCQFLTEKATGAASCCGTAGPIQVVVLVDFALFFYHQLPGHRSRSCSLAARVHTKSRVPSTTASPSIRDPLRRNSFRGRLQSASRLIGVDLIAQMSQRRYVRARMAQSSKTCSAAEAAHTIRELLQRVSMRMCADLRRNKTNLTLLFASLARRMAFPTA